MPPAVQEPPTADFGTLRYGQQAACDIVLRNIGAVSPAMTLPQSSSSTSGGAFVPN